MTLKIGDNMLTVGIHDGHNSSICLLDDNEVISLLQEERIRYVKNYFGFPSLSLDAVLKQNSLTIEDIDCFVFNGNHIPYAGDKDKLISNYKKSSSNLVALKYLLKNTPIYSIFKKIRRKDRTLQLTKMGISTSKIKFVNHHLAHASAAYYGCPWVKNDEKVLILTQDGSGDGLSGSVNIGVNGKIENIAKINKDDSLGRLYATVTFMLGMVPLEHEYKLMGMAPYAPDSGSELSYEVFKDILHVDDIIIKRNKDLPPMQRIYSHLREKTEFHRFDWVAAGIQKLTEEILVKWVKNCIQYTEINKIVLSGGTFMNVKANQKISELKEVENIFIFPSCGDESNSLGAAYNYYYNKNPQEQIKGISHLYLGPESILDDKNCKNEILKFKNRSSIDFTYDYFDNIELKIAELLAEGKIIARCKGSMEFGARALGNRSILSDASDLNKITIINNMIKKRDFWMPFAPVMLEERSDEYVKNPKNLECPYMMITLESTSNYKEFIGGVQQIDLTARPQIINKNQNKDYYTVLKEYERLTGRGVLINTSFNLHGLPIVYGPKEAIHVFENSGLEFLALGNYLLSKSNQTI